MLRGIYSRKTKSWNDILLPVNFHCRYTTARQEREKQLQKYFYFLKSHRRAFNKVRNEAADDYTRRLLWEFTVHSLSCILH